MTPWVTRLGARRRSAVLIRRGIVIRVGLGQRGVVVPMLMRGRTMLMRRMVMSGVLVDVQRRHDTWRGHDSRNE